MKFKRVRCARLKIQKELSCGYSPYLRRFLACLITFRSKNTRFVAVFTNLPVKEKENGRLAPAGAALVPSGFSSVVLPIFGTTTDKFRQLYPPRLASQHQSPSRTATIPAGRNTGNDPPNTESGFKPGIECGIDLPWAFLVLSALFGERLPGEDRGAGAARWQWGDLEIR